MTTFQQISLREPTFGNHGSSNRDWGGGGGGIRTGVPRGGGGGGGELRRISGAYFLWVLRRRRLGRLGITGVTLTLQPKEGKTKNQSTQNERRRLEQSRESKSAASVCVPKRRGRVRVPFDAWEKKVYCDYHRTAKMISYYYSTAEIHFASSTPFQLPPLSGMRLSF